MAVSEIIVNANGSGVESKYDKCIFMFHQSGAGYSWGWFADLAKNDTSEYLDNVTTYTDSSGVVFNFGNFSAYNSDLIVTPPAGKTVDVMVIAQKQSGGYDKYTQTVTSATTFSTLYRLFNVFYKVN